MSADQWSRKYIFTRRRETRRDGASWNGVEIADCCEAILAGESDAAIAARHERTTIEITNRRIWLTEKRSEGSPHESAMA